MKHEVAKLIASLKEAEELVIYVEGYDDDPQEKVDDDYHELQMYRRYGERRPELLEQAHNMIKAAFRQYVNAVEPGDDSMIDISIIDEVW